MSNTFALPNIHLYLLIYIESKPWNSSTIYQCFFCLHDVYIFSYWPRALMSKITAKFANYIWLLHIIEIVISFLFDNRHRDFSTQYTYLPNVILANFVFIQPCNYYYYYVYFVLRMQINEVEGIEYIRIKDKRKWTDW